MITIGDKTIILTVKEAREFGKDRHQFAIDNGFVFILIFAFKSKLQKPELIPGFFRPCEMYSAYTFLEHMRFNIINVDSRQYLNRAQNIAREHNEGGTGFRGGNGPINKLARLWHTHQDFLDKAARFAFMNQIEAVFGDVVDYVEDREAMVVQFKMCYRPPRFDDLERLSKILGTKKINLSETLYTPGCETCDHGAKYSTPISCWNVQFPAAST
jgi:hypothetical protein